MKLMNILQGQGGGVRAGFETFVFSAENVGPNSRNLEIEQTN